MRKEGLKFLKPLGTWPVPRVLDLYDSQSETNSTVKIKEKPVVFLHEDR